MESNGSSNRSNLIERLSWLLKSVANAAKENHSGNFIRISPAKTVDRRTANNAARNTIKHIERRMCPAANVGEHGIRNAIFVAIADAAKA